MFPCSVTATAGIFNAAAWSSSSSMRHAPSSSEYSVCRCKCTNSGMTLHFLTSSLPHFLTSSLPHFLTSYFLTSLSLPFDRRGRLRADVVDDAVDALHLVDEAGGD